MYCFSDAHEVSMDAFKHLKPGATTYRSELDPTLLDTFPNPRPERRYEVRFVTREVTSLCPVTGQPDFYTVEVAYIPDTRCIESKSLKLYLFSLRNTGLFAEDMANRILEDLVEACAPRWIRVICHMNPRGGLSLTVKAEEGKPPEETP
jgi:7-cyano-7-deazaguanine reductase